MARKDIFGIERTTKSSKELGSSEFAVININGKSPSLVQALQYSYGREVNPVFEVGSSSVFFQGGRATGQVSMSRLVGKQGFQALIEGADEKCGEIGAITVQLRGGQCKAAPAGRSRITFDDAMLTSVGGELSAATANITESAQMLIAGMSVG